MKQNFEEAVGFVHNTVIKKKKCCFIKTTQFYPKFFKASFNCKDKLIIHCYANIYLKLISCLQVPVRNKMTVQHPKAEVRRDWHPPDHLFRALWSWLLLEDILSADWYSFRGRTCSLLSEGSLLSVTHASEHLTRHTSKDPESISKALWGSSQKPDASAVSQFDPFCGPPG